MTPTVSVVIPMYNARQWIEETLQSVLAQTYPANQLEIIIVDDKSTDDSVAVARAFAERHGMRATVLEAERNRGVGAARNRGWRAASGEWIQFLDADDLLAADKIRLQAHMLPIIGDDVAVICSSWQRLGMAVGGQWQPCGPVVTPELDEAMILRLVSLNAGFLGPTLIRKRFLQAVSGFSEDVRFAEDEHIMLKIAAACGRFLEAPSSLPMFFIRQTPGSKSRRAKSKVARQHLENVVVAERMLREMRQGMLTPRDRKQLSSLCDWSLSELYEHDRAAFRQYLHWIRDIDPKFIPEHRPRLKFAARVVGYENAEGLALAYRRLKIWTALALIWLSLEPLVAYLDF